MTVLQALILGCVEGVSEFLPISSTGHLILTGKLLGLSESEFLKSFEIAIQLGAILSVVALYGRTLLVNRSVLLRVAVAFVPTGVIGFLVHGLFRDYLIGSESVVLWSLFLGGVALIVFERWHVERRDAAAAIDDMTLVQAFWIGCFQSVAIVPGVSRAAATIVGGLLLDIKRPAIVTFSFLLAVPTMAAATGYDLLKTASAFTGQEFLLLAVGFATSFVVALLAIRWFVRFVQHHTFTGFGWYRIGVAAAFWFAGR